MSTVTVTLTIKNLKLKQEEVWCCSYCDREFETKFGTIVHERSCKSKNVKTQALTKQSGVCYRCGRTGHYVAECYANTHAKGYYLDD